MPKNSLNHSPGDSKNVYSVTIAFARGINLGLNPMQKALRVLEGISSEFIFTEEKTKKGFSHLQAGIISRSRQDNIRRDILNCFPDLSAHERRYAVKVKKHNDWQILVNYCTKQFDPFKHKLITAKLEERPKFTIDYMKHVAAQHFRETLPNFIDMDCRSCTVDERCTIHQRFCYDYALDFVDSYYESSYDYLYHVLISRSV